MKKKENTKNKETIIDEKESLSVVQMNHKPKSDLKWFIWHNIINE